MQIKALNSMPAFGRRLRRDEKKELGGIIQEAKERLGIENTTAAIFDFTFPK